MNNPLSLTDPSGFSWWTKHRRQVIGIVAGILTAVAATWAIGAYALANGATIFASASGALNGLGMATAAAAGGFASGGIMGGNIQSALRGAFTAFVTAGVLQGMGDLMSGGAAQSGVEISQGAQNYQMGAPTVNLEVPITSDAGGGMGSSMPAPINEAQIAPYRLPTILEINGTRTPVVPIGDYSNASSFARFMNNWVYNPANAVPMGAVAGALVRGATTAAKSVAASVVENATTRVGRWMSEKEFKLMNETGRVVEGAGGRTYVVNPANPASYTSAGQGSRIYAEFDVPTEVLRAGSKPEWSVIPGPNVTTRLYGPAPSELAPATCITCVIRKP